MEERRNTIVSTMSSCSSSQGFSEVIIIRKCQFREVIQSHSKYLSVLDLELMYKSGKGIKELSTQEIHISVEVP